MSPSSGPGSRDRRGGARGWVASTSSGWPERAHLLSAGYDVSDCVLACFSAAGFHDDLSGAKESRLALDDIYAR